MGSTIARKQKVYDLTTKIHSINRREIIRGSATLQL